MLRSMISAAATLAVLASVSGVARAEDAWCWAPVSTSAELGDDNFWAACTEATFRDNMVGRYQLDEDDWDEGWGWGDMSHSSGFARLLCGLYLMNDPALPQNGNIVSWAGSYVEKNATDIKGKCWTDDAPRARASMTVGEGLEFLEIFGPQMLEVGPAMLDGNWGGEIVLRASTLLHESRHHDGYKHASDDCTLGGSCDESFEKWGANAYTVSYIANYVAHDLRTATPNGNRLDPKNLKEILDYANSYMVDRFNTRPSFRLEQLMPFKIVQNGQVDDALLTPTNLQTRPANPNDEAVVTALANDNHRPMRNETVIAPFANSACFLTGIQGKFERTTEWIQIQKHVETVGGITLESWKLAVQSDRTSDNETLVGRARCIPTSKPLHMSDWYQLNEDEWQHFWDVGFGQDHACYLTGVRGEINGQFEGVRLYINHLGRWTLRLQSTEQDGDSLLAATVGCIPASNVTREDGFDGEEVTLRSSGSVPDPLLTAIPTAMCALNALHGNFDGHQEYVEVRPTGNIDPATLPFDWRFKVDDNRGPIDETVSGEVVCFEP